MPNQPETLICLEEGAGIANRVQRILHFVETGIGQRLIQGGLRLVCTCPAQSG